MNKTGNLAFSLSAAGMAAALDQNEAQFIADVRAGMVGPADELLRGEPVWSPAALAKALDKYLPYGCTPPERLRLALEALHKAAKAEGWHDGHA